MPLPPLPDDPLVESGILVFGETVSTVGSSLLLLVGALVVGVGVVPLPDPGVGVGVSGVGVPGAGVGDTGGALVGGAEVGGAAVGGAAVGGAAVGGGLVGGALVGGAAVGPAPLPSARKRRRRRFVMVEEASTPVSGYPASPISERFSQAFSRRRVYRASD